jgi:hypothetical protein
MEKFPTAGRCIFASIRGFSSRIAASRQDARDRRAEWRVARALGKILPNATRIVGCDVNPRCAALRFDDPRIGIVVGSAVDESVREKILSTVPSLDVVIDDGSHQSREIIAAFCSYFPRIADGGVFIAEDLHCSYWSKFEGGLFHPLSAISFFKERCRRRQPRALGSADRSSQAARAVLLTLRDTDIGRRPSPRSLGGIREFDVRCSEGTT